MRNTVLIHPDELSERWIARACKHGYTGIALHPVGGNDAPNTLADLLERLQSPAYRKLIDRVADAGLTVEYELHAAGYLFPRCGFETHPERFRKNQDGVRSADYNLCFSNEDALEEAAENARKLAGKLYRTEPNLYFWADDARNSFCFCEDCARMTPSDQNLFFMNRLLAAIRKDHPQMRMACLAYADTMALPVSVRPSEGIFLEYAPFDRDMHAPISGQESAKAGNVKELLAFFGRRNAKVLDYWMDNSYYSKWTKPPKKYVPDTDVVRADLAYYRSLGFETVSSFACYLGDDYVSLYGEPELPRLDG
ncbi:MAG: DUF4838 domain-containing protein [Clostridia bacterium]|nr:DUF4838 domain-containing protein [Clostridia bacterium]